MDYYAMVRDVMKLDEIDEAVVNEAWADDYIRSHIEDFQWAVETPEVYALWRRPVS